MREKNTMIQSVQTTSWEKQDMIEEHLKDPIVARGEALKCVEHSC